MKKLLVFLVLAFGLVAIASAQHRGGYSGGHNSVQHNGGYNNGWQHNGYNSGYRHGGYGWVAPLFIGAGATYLLTQPYYEPPVVYYESLPRVVPAPQQSNNCHREIRKIFDEKGAPLGEQVLLVCPLATTAPLVVTQ